MATCRQCNLYRPGLNAQGICPSCVRFHGESAPPTPAQRSKPHRPAVKPQATACSENADTLTFADLFPPQAAPSPAPQPKPQPDTAAAANSKALRILQRALPKLPIRTPEEQARSAAEPTCVLASQPSVEQLLALDEADKLSIEQLDRILDASASFGLSPEQCRQLRGSLQRKLQKRGPIQPQPSPLVQHSQGDWWSAER